MSRIIVKNLPSNVDKNKLHKSFSELGLVTDIQLKYASSGKFRKFAFIGYDKEEAAEAAIKHFDKSFYGTSRISVELCADLGDENKPRSWSKYAADSSHNKKPDEIKEKEPKKIDKKRKIHDEELLEKIESHKSDPAFVEFMELHGKADNILPIVDDEPMETETIDDNVALDPHVSDAEYLKLKSKGVNKEKVITSIKNKEPDNFRTNLRVKLSNLPYKTTKSDIKEIFDPIKILSIKMPNVKGIAFVRFETEKDFKQAIIRNRTFFHGKRIFITEIQPSKKEEINENQKWKDQENSLKNEESIAESGSIFVRNLSYGVQEKDLIDLFSPFGKIAELTYPLDHNTRMHKGFAIITYMLPENAIAAYSSLDGTSFHGRMLHLLPAITREKKEEIHLNFKDKKLSETKKKAGLSHNWNTLFLDMNAVASTVAEKYNVTKEDVLTGKDIAVRMALAESQLVAETKDFLVSNGVKLDIFNQEVKSRSNTVILVKNLPANTKPSEIRDLFASFGELGKVVLPPSGVTAIVEFLESSEAKTAFRRLAYSKFKNLPLYLEWAPENTFNGENLLLFQQLKPNFLEPAQDVKKDEEEEEETGLLPEEDTTLFVKNLSFDTTEDNLRKHFDVCGKIYKVSVAKKKDPKKPGSLLSMGYGFVHFYKKSSINEALKILQLSSLDGHLLELKRSNRTLIEQVVNTRKTTNVKEQTGSKILVRNIPFEATEREIANLFKTFGELKCARLPKKLVGTGPHRGFAFVEYVTKADAKRAMKTLCESTHLLGRRLVLEWAQTNADDVNQLRSKTAKHFHERKPSKKFDEELIKVHSEDMDVEDDDEDLV